MPRKGRGGSRNGRPQTAYPNRSDLNAPKVPVVRLQGQTYGEQAQQVARQQAVPPGPPPATADINDVALQHPFPAVPPMTGDTAYPREPLTAGMAMGAGPGPEANAILRPNTVHPGARLLTYLASLPTATPEIQRLAYSVGRESFTPAPNPDDLYDALGD